MENNEQQHLEEFAMLLAMLRDDERYAAIVDLLDVAERHNGEAKAE